MFYFKTSNLVISSRKLSFYDQMANVTVISGFGVGVIKLIQTKI